jgi:predicted enzyme related to lactoylglutathione lyase
MASNSANGRFCWFELGTTDQTAAKQFYSSVFGWTANDMDMGPGQVYTIFKIGEDDVAAAYTLKPEMVAQRVPPHWLLYVRVASADAAADRTAALGGKIVQAPFDVGSMGRMSVLEDPTGAMFCVWRPGQNLGVTVSGPAGTAVWADLSTTDQKRAADFYHQVFGWQIVDGKDMNPAAPGHYAHIVNGNDFIGGIPPGDGRMPAHWLTYFQVDDFSATLAKIKSLGGRVLYEHEMPGVREFAYLTDPQGASFAIVKSLGPE